MSGPTFAGFDEQNRTVLLRGPFGAPYVINPQCAATFKFACGDIVAPRKGAQLGRIAVILGEMSGTLWVHFLDEHHATPLKFCNSFAQLLDAYDLQAVQPARGSVGAQTVLGCTFYFRTSGLFETFGLHAGERAHIGSVRKNCTVVGELFGILWVRYDDAPTIAAPLVGATSEDSLRSMYSLCEEFTPARGTTPIPSPRRTPRAGGAGGASQPYVVDETRKVAVCAQPFGKIEVDISNKTLRDEFSVMHGQRLTAKRGALDGQVSTVVGVRSGALYIHTDGEKYVTCCRNCHNAADLHEVYGFEISGAASGQSKSSATSPSPSITRHVPPPIPPAATAAAGRGHAVASDDSPASPTTVHPPRHFQCWTAFGRLDFDSSEAGCKPFGFYHQQTVKATLGPEKGNVFHVVGERMGTLWVLPDGRNRAIALAHCRNGEDIKKRYGFVVVGKHSLRHLTAVVDEPPPTPIVSPRGGSSSLATSMPSPRGGAFGSASPDRGDAAGGASLSAASPVPMLNLGFARSTPGGGADGATASSSSPREASPEAAERPSLTSSTAARDRSTEDPWVDGRMPATRNYLKAVALLKTGAPSDAAAPTAFHQYYLVNASQRLTQAMRQLPRFREAWEQDRARAAAPCAFSHATTEEMFRVMQSRRDIFA